MPVGSHACPSSDTSSPKTARLEKAVSLGTLYTQRVTHTQAVPWPWSGLPSGISISAPDDGGGRVLSASAVQASRVGSKQEAHLPGDSSAACRSGVVDTQVRGLCDKLGAIKYKCIAVRSSMSPALLPEVSSGAFISLQGIAVAKHISISVVPNTASLLLPCFDVLRNLT